MTRVSDAFDTALGSLAASLPELLAAAIVFLLLLLAGRAVALATGRVLARGDRSERYGALTRRIIRWTFGLVGLVLALQILGLTAVATSLLATGGLVAIVLGFAFREIGENLLAGLLLGLSRSFEVGDLIESSGHMGVVSDIQLRHVHVRAADGRDIFIPSAQIFRNVLVNYTRDGLRRGEFVVGVDYRDPIEEGRECLLAAVREVEGVLREPAPSVRVSAFAPQYVELQVFFWVDTFEGPGLAQIRTGAMHAGLRALRARGFTLSSEVSSAVELGPVAVALRERDEG